MHLDDLGPNAAYSAPSCQVRIPDVQKLTSEAKSIGQILDEPCDS